jgi:hypothetical protein
MVARQWMIAVVMDFATLRRKFASAWTVGAVQVTFPSRKCLIVLKECVLQDYPGTAYRRRLRQRIMWWLSAPTWVYVPPIRVNANAFLALPAKHVSGVRLHRRRHQSSQTKKYSLDAFYTTTIKCRRCRCIHKRHRCLRRIYVVPSSSPCLPYN